MITKHINNVFSERECCENNNVQILHNIIPGRPTTIYSLDVIISVGYRVKSLRGTEFRRWATKVLKEHLLRGYSLNKRLGRVEEKLNEHDAHIGNLQESAKFHDRFLIIDDKELFLIGASIKDLGRKCFAFTKLDSKEISGLKSKI